MPGETNLAQLLRSMDPVLQEGEYVFATVDAEIEVPAVCRFQEREGVSLILLHEEAERHGLGYTYPCRMITLNVHSSLEAVGFLAAIATRLAAQGISANVVSAFHHDHLFVPSADAVRALTILRGLSKSQPSL